MSADRPPAPVDPGHSLNSILSGHAKAADRDSGLAEHRDDDATLEAGPPRTPSAGRPLEADAAAEPFTPPVPSIQTLRGLLTDGLDDPVIGTQTSHARRRLAFASTPGTVWVPRPSWRVGALGLVVIGVALVAALDGAQRSTRSPREATAPPRAATAGRAERTPATTPKRRGSSNELRATRRARVPITRPASRPPNTGARPVAAPAEMARPVPAARPVAPAARAGGSRFTSEFTP